AGRVKNADALAVARGGLPAETENALSPIAFEKLLVLLRRRLLCVLGFLVSHRGFLGVLRLFVSRRRRLYRIFSFLDRLLVDCLQFVVDLLFNGALLCGGARDFGRGGGGGGKLRVERFSQF